MRKIILISCVLVATIASNCRSGTGKNSANSGQNTNIGSSEIIFREYQHDFGKVDEGEKLSYTFTFDNKGTANLIISSATTSCGCTVPKYDTKPISPGATGNLEVVFDTSGRSGIETKTVTIHSNASKPVVMLRITAEVVPGNK